jgi:hypothetical protein
MMRSRKISVIPPHIRSAVVSVADSTLDDTMATYKAARLCQRPSVAV